MCNLSCALQLETKVKQHHLQALSGETQCHRSHDYWGFWRTVLYYIFSQYLCDGRMESPLMQHVVCHNVVKWKQNMHLENCCCNAMLMTHLYGFCVTALSNEIIRYPVQKRVTHHHSSTDYTFLVPNRLNSKNAGPYIFYCHLSFFYYPFTLDSFPIKSAVSKYKITTTMTKSLQLLWSLMWHHQGYFLKSNWNCFDYHGFHLKAFNASHKYNSNNSIRQIQELQQSTENWSPTIWMIGLFLMAFAGMPNI